VLAVGAEARADLEAVLLCERLNRIAAVEFTSSSTSSTVVCAHGHTAETLTVIAALSTGVVTQRRFERLWHVWNYALHSSTITYVSSFGKVTEETSRFIGPLIY